MRASCSWSAARQAAPFCERSRLAGGVLSKGNRRVVPAPRTCALAAGVARALLEHCLTLGQ
eukprot:3399462-Pleurochrysis_carterae.AAC.1